ncbi:MAG: sensor histidine kinase [Firmicutes bacterium]|nr:sensor histidine kinase [Bacillota bacterium]
MPTESPVTAMEQIMAETVAALDRSKAQMFEVANNVRDEYLRVRTELEEIKRRTAEVVDQVDKAEKRYKALRLKLIEVSSDFSRYSEEDIRSAYEQAQNAQMELVLAREREEELKKLRADTERRLVRLNNLVSQAEDMIGSLSTALDLVAGKLNGMAAKIEGYKTWNQMGNQIIQAQEEERRRIAREIHDGPAQAMSNIVLRAEICEKIYETGKGSLREELAELKELVKESLKEVRQIIFNLRPMTLDDLGLVPALSQYIEEYKKSVDFAVKLEVFGKDRRLPKAIEVAFFRLIQEALHNVKKHAKASEVEVNLRFQDKWVVATVSDDGIGFDLEKVEEEKESKDHFGLMTMRERAELLSGQFEIETAPGKGTRISARIPVPEGDAAGER